MRKPPPQSLKDVRFHNPRLAKVGVEAMSLAQLRERAGATLGPPERVEFLELLLVESGRGTHSVDFTDYELQPGTVVLVRPGQVQQWRLTRSLQGHVVLVSVEALAPTIARGQLDMKLLGLDEWPTSSRPERPLFVQILADVARMQVDIGRFVGTDVEASIIWHEWMTVLLRLARDRAAKPQAAAAFGEAQVQRLFLRELEASLHKRPSVRDFARRIGYSESTLSRACLAATGRTAKQAVDGRVALEAKRLLAHSDAPVAEIAYRLGFSEPTNFVKFFRRTAGLTPLEFRRRSRA
ncbi:MAG: helix-turn-helix transcriptional regulator [Burkholderiales bacterium]|nr:helix-turn-helix transcriptional regulator [Burkholderiales bacterium]